MPPTSLHLPAATQCFLPPYTSISRTCTLFLPSTPGPSALLPSTPAPSLPNAPSHLQAWVQLDACQLREVRLEALQQLRMGCMLLREPTRNRAAAPQGRTACKGR